MGYDEDVSESPPAQRPWIITLAFSWTEHLRRGRATECFAQQHDSCTDRDVNFS
ncbi:hypothetical protein ACFXG4_17965 [Nocardia sp. NPDC059246]|uniref:hypothetical protein n=1 Tax=unclassified Nocardia TaxID=2637762 RepID=UPI0036B14D0B